MTSKTRTTKKEDKLANELFDKLFNSFKEIINKYKIDHPWKVNFPPVFFEKQELLHQKWRKFTISKSRKIKYKTSEFLDRALKHIHDLKKAAWIAETSRILDDQYG